VGSLILLHSMVSPFIAVENWGATNQWPNKKVWAGFLV
jgi:hypothetical protein